MVTVSAINIRHLNPGLTADQAATIASAISGCLGDGGITTTDRLCHFIAQTATETWGFKRLRESFAYSDPSRLLAVFPSHFPSEAAAAEAQAKGQEYIANIVYAGRFGNGDCASGDGWRYRGGGALNTTFKDNYRQFGDAIGTDLVTHPELTEDPVTAFKLAAKFWNVRHCNALADVNDIFSITKVINGGINGLNDRKTWLADARRVFT